MYNPKYRESYARANAAMRVRMKQWFRDLKDQPCMDCGGRFPPECMDFDHRDRSSKKMAVGTMMNKRASKKSILEEAAKCDLVCANCHRIRTHSHHR